MLPSGTQALFNNRVGWARTYLKQAGFLESPRRGLFFWISDAGRALLAGRPEQIDNSTPECYQAFREFRSRKRPSKIEKHENYVHRSDSDSDETPEDALASAYTTIRNEIESEILESVMQASPAFFERLVVHLLVQMGYGGNRQDAARAVGRSGDGGIDGIINEDQLGLDVIFIQAKRWESNVGWPEVQKFSGALQGQRARKGILITTSAFSVMR